MSKYDFGYELEKGSTNEWAFQMVHENCRVLEIGPAIGNLTYHLSVEKECQVDIVEIDDDAGRKASQFASNAQIGSIDGDLNTDVWFENLKDERYDYIISLDVLEHLEHPEHVLENLKILLKDDGQILLSIPNLAHNAVILELLQNNFQYHDLGLLDRTHIHFFAYESILKMIENVNLHINYIDAIKKSVSDTEINSSFECVPVEVEQYLKSRKYANVYQYLVILGKKKTQIIDKIQDGIMSQDLCQTIVLVDGLIKNQSVFQNHYDDVFVEIYLNEYENASCIRLVPVEQRALVYDLHAYGIDKEGEKKELFYNWTSGIQINNTCVVLTDKNSELNYPVDSKHEKIEIQFKCKFLSDEIVHEIVKLDEQNRKMLQENQKKTEINASLRQEIEEKMEVNASLRQEIEEKMEVNASLMQELSQIKSHFLYRVYMRLLRIVHRDK